jgi:DNA repair protein RadC
MAVLELARRAVAEQLKAREVFSSPDAVKNYLQLHLGGGRTKSSPRFSSTRRTS